MYMVAERGSNQPIKLNSIRFYESLETFLKEKHIEYINIKTKTSKFYYANYENFGKYLTGYYRNQWFVYECLETKKKPKNLFSKEELVNELLSKYGYDPKA